MRGDKSDRPTTKITIRVFSDDVELARRLYPKAGYNNLIRSLFARHMNALRELQAQRAANTEPPEDIIL